MKEMIEVRQALYFIAVAEELHFGRAAERLSMSQPPLSQAIRQLERMLGANLLERSTRAVQLTEAGRWFLDECRALVDTSVRAAEAAHRASAGMVGTLRVGAVTSALSDLLPQIVRMFKESRPLVELHVREINTQDARDALLRREIDVAVIRQAASTRSLAATPLRRDRLALAMPLDHPFAASEGPVELDAFRDDSWVWHQRHLSPEYHDEIALACRAAGFSPEPKHVANSIHSQLAMVEAGLGVTLAPESSIRRRPWAIAWRELAQPADMVELSLVSRANDTETLVAHFMACAVAGGRDH